MSEDLQYQWHESVSKELEARVKNRMFFLTVAVEPERAGRGPAKTPKDVDAPTWETTAQSVEQWLEGLDPDAVDQDDPPTHELRPEEVAVQLTAIPKKTNRRGTDPLVLNPYPGVTAFTGSYTTGPPPEFDDGT